MLQTALEMNKHAEIVSSKEITSIPDKLLDRVGFKHIKTITPKWSGGRAYVAINKKKELIVVFRGTDSDDKKEKISNIFTDINSLKKKMSWLENHRKFKGVKAHMGFVNEYERFRVEIIKIVKKHRKSTIFVTGHSLGGALATLCALDIRVNMKVPVYLYTSGSPRVICGDKFVKLFNERVDTKFRIALKKDPVSLVPLRRCYKHVGNLLELNSDGSRVPLNSILPLSKIEPKNLKTHHTRCVYRCAIEEYLYECSRESCYKKGILYRSAIRERER